MEVSQKVLYQKCYSPAMATEGVVSEVVSEKPVEEETGELSGEQCPGPLKLEKESSGNSTDKAALVVDEKVKTDALLNVTMVGGVEFIDCGALIRTANQSISQGSPEGSTAVQSICPGNLEYSEGEDFTESPSSIHVSSDEISKDLNASLDEEKRFEIGKETIRSDTLWQNDNIGEMEKKDENTEREGSSEAKEKDVCDATLARQRSREWSSENEKEAKVQDVKAMELASKEGITGNNVEEVLTLAVKDLDCLNLQKEKLEDEMAFSKDNLKTEGCNKMEAFEINKENLSRQIDLTYEKIETTESLTNIKYETTIEKIEREETGQVEDLQGLQQNEKDIPDNIVPALPGSVQNQCKNTVTSQLGLQEHITESIHPSTEIVGNTSRDVVVGESSLEKGKNIDAGIGDHLESDKKNDEVAGEIKYALQMHNVRCDSPATVKEVHEINDKGQENFEDSINLEKKTESRVASNDGKYVAESDEVISLDKIEADTDSNPKPNEAEDKSPLTEKEYLRELHTGEKEKERYVYSVSEKFIHEPTSECSMEWNIDENVNYSWPNEDKVVTEVNETNSGTNNGKLEASILNADSASEGSPEYQAEEKLKDNTDLSLERPSTEATEERIESEEEQEIAGKKFDFLSVNENPQDTTLQEHRGEMNMKCRIPHLEEHEHESVENESKGKAHEREQIIPMVELDNVSEVHVSALTAERLVKDEEQKLEDLPYVAPEGIGHAVSATVKDQDNAAQESKAKVHTSTSEGELHITQCSTDVALQDEEGQKIEAEELSDSLSEEKILSTEMSKNDETIADSMLLTTDTPAETFQGDEMVTELQVTSRGRDENESSTVVHRIEEGEHERDQEVSSTACKDIDGSANEDKKKQDSSEIKLCMQDISQNVEELDMETQKSQGRDQCEHHKPEHGKKASKSIDTDRTIENVSVQENETAELHEQQSFDKNQEIINLGDDVLNEGTDAIKFVTSSSAQSTVEKCLLNKHQENEKFAELAEKIQEEENFYWDNDLDEEDSQVSECKTLQGSDSHSEECSKQTGADYEASQTDTQEDAGLTTIESSAREKMNEGDPQSNTEKCKDTVGYEEGNMKAVTQRDERDDQKHDNHLETLSFGDEAAEGHTYTEKEHMYKEPNCSKILETETQEDEMGVDKHEEEADQQITDCQESSTIENFSEETKDAHIKEEKREDFTILQQENMRTNDLKEEDIIHEDHAYKSNTILPVTRESVGKTMEEEEDIMQKEAPRFDTEEAIHGATNINMIVGTGCESHEKSPVEAQATFGRAEENESISDIHLKEQAGPARDQEASSALSKDVDRIADEETQKKVYSEIELSAQDTSKSEGEINGQDDEILVPHEHLSFNKNEEIITLGSEEDMKGGATGARKSETPSSVQSTEDKCLLNEHQETEKLAATAKVIQEDDQSHKVTDPYGVESHAKKGNTHCVSDSQVEEGSENTDNRQTQTVTEEDGGLTTIESSEMDKMDQGALKSHTEDDKPTVGDEEGNLKAVVPTDERVGQKLDNHWKPLSFRDDAVGGGTYVEGEQAYKELKCSEVLETITQEDRRECDRLEEEADKQTLDTQESSKQDNLSEETKNTHIKEEKIKEGTVPEQENKRTVDLKETNEEHIHKSNALLCATHELAEETLEEIGNVQKETPRSGTEQVIHETTNIHMTIETGCKKHEKNPTELQATRGTTEENEIFSDTNLTEQVTHVRYQKDASTLPEGAGESPGEDIQNKCCPEMEPCGEENSEINKELDTHDDQITIFHESISFNKNQEAIIIPGNEGQKEGTTDTIRFETSSSPGSTEGECLQSENQENEKLEATAKMIQEENQIHKDKDLCEADIKANEYNNLWGLDSQAEESSNKTGADHEPSQADAQEDGSLTTIGSSAREKMNDKAPRANTEECKDTPGYEEGNLKAVTRSDEDSEPLPLGDVAARGDTYTEKECKCEESDCSKIPETKTQEEEGEEEGDKLQEEAIEQLPENQESPKPENVDQENKIAHMMEEKRQDMVTLEQEGKNINDLKAESIIKEEHPAKSNAFLSETCVLVEKTMEEEEDIMQKEAPKSDNEVTVHEIPDIHMTTGTGHENNEMPPVELQATFGRTEENESTSDTHLQEQDESARDREVSSTASQDEGRRTEEDAQNKAFPESKVCIENILKDDRELDEKKEEKVIPHEHIIFNKNQEITLRGVEVLKEGTTDAIKFEPSSSVQSTEEKCHLNEQHENEELAGTAETIQEEDQSHKDMNPYEVDGDDKKSNTLCRLDSQSQKRLEKLGANYEPSQTDSLTTMESLEGEILNQGAPKLSTEECEHIEGYEDGNLKAVTESKERDGQKLHEHHEPLSFEDNTSEAGIYTEKEHIEEEPKSSKILETDTQEEEREAKELEEEAYEQTSDDQQSSKLENLIEVTKHVYTKKEKSQNGIGEEQKKTANDFTEENITNKEHRDKSNVLLPVYHESVKETLEEEVVIMQKDVPSCGSEEVITESINIHMRPETKGEKDEESPAEPQATLGRIEENKTDSVTQLMEESEHERDQECSSTVTKEAVGSIDGDSQSKSSSPVLYERDILKDDRELHMERPKSEDRHLSEDHKLEHDKVFKTTDAPHEHLSLNDSPENSLVRDMVLNEGTSDAMKPGTSSPVEFTQVKYLLNEQQENEKFAAITEPIKEKHKLDLYEMDSQDNKCNTLWEIDSQAEKSSKNVGTDYEQTQTNAQEDGSLSATESSAREEVNQEAHSDTKICNDSISYAEENLKADPQSDERDEQKLESHLKPLHFGDEAARAGEDTEKEHIYKELNCSKIVETSTKEEEKEGDKLEEQADEQMPNNQKSSKVENLSEETNNGNDQYVICPEQEKTKDLKGEDYPDKSNDLSTVSNASVEETMEEVGILQKEASTFDTEETFKETTDVHITTEIKSENYEKSLKSLSSDQDYGITTDKESTMNDTTSYNAMLDKGTLSSLEKEQNEIKKLDEEHIHGRKKDDEDRERNIEVSAECTHETVEETCIQVLQARITNGTKMLAEDAQDNAPQMNESGRKQPENSFAAKTELKLATQKEHDQYVEEEKSSQEDVREDRNLEEVVADTHPRSEMEKIVDHAELNNASETKIMHKTNLHDNERDLPVTPELITEAMNTEVDQMNEATPLICEEKVHGNTSKEIIGDDAISENEKHREGSECELEDTNQEMAYEMGVTAIENAALSPLQIFEEERMKKVAPPLEAQVQTNKETKTSKSIHNQKLEEEGTTNKEASAAITEQNTLEDEKVEKDSELAYKERPGIVAIHNIEEERAKQENSYASIEEDLSQMLKELEMPAEEVTSEKQTIQDEEAYTNAMAIEPPTLEQNYNRGEIEAKYEEETCESNPKDRDTVPEKANNIVEMGVPNEEVESDFIPLPQGLKQTADKESAKDTTIEANSITVKVTPHEDENCSQIFERGKILCAVDTEEELTSIHLQDNQRNIADESNIAVTRRIENKEVEESQETKLEAVETEQVKIDLSEDNDIHDEACEKQIDGTIGSYKEFTQNHKKSSRTEVINVKTLSNYYGNEEIGGSSLSKERSDDNLCLTLSESGNDIHLKNHAEETKENILEKEASTKVHEVTPIGEVTEEMLQNEEKREKRPEEEETLQECEPNSNTANEILTGQVEEPVSKTSKHKLDVTDSEEPIKVTSLHDEVEKSTDLLPELIHEAVVGDKQHTQFELEEASRGESIDEVQGLGTTLADSETSATTIYTEDGEHEAEACRSLFIKEQSVEKTNTQKVEESEELPGPNPVSKASFENKEIRKTTDEVPSMNILHSSDTDVTAEQITFEEMDEELVVQEMDEELVVQKGNNITSASNDISGAEVSDEAKDIKMTTADLLSTSVTDSANAKEESSASVVPVSLGEPTGQEGHGKEPKEEISLDSSEKTKQNFNPNEDKESRSKPLAHNIEMMGLSEEIEAKTYLDKGQNKSCTAELPADDTTSAEVSNKFEKSNDSPLELPKDEGIVINDVADARDKSFEGKHSTTSTAVFEESIHGETISDEKNNTFSLEGVDRTSGSVEDQEVEIPSSSSAPINITHITKHTNQISESASDVHHYASTAKRELGGVVAYNDDGKQHLEASNRVSDEQTGNEDSQEITMSGEQSEFLACTQVSVAKKLTLEEGEVMKTMEDDNHELTNFGTSQNDQDKQEDVSYLPVSQVLIDQIMREEDEKSQMMIQEEGIEDGCEGVDNMKQELDISADKDKRTEECISQNKIEVPKSYDAQEFPIDEGEPKSIVSSFPSMETLVEDAKKEVLSENLTDIIKKDDEKHATSEKSETQSDLKNGELIDLGPRTREKSNGVTDVTEQKVALNDNKALIEHLDTPSVAKADGNKILQEERCPKFMEAREIQPRIEMLEKATIEEHPPETLVTIETKNFIGINENLLKTQEPSAPLEVNKVLGGTSDFTPEEEEIKAQVDNKHDGITDTQTEGHIETTRLPDSGKNHPSESGKDSIDNSNPIAEISWEQRSLAINRDELNKEEIDMQAGIDETKNFIGIDETLSKNKEPSTPVLEVNQFPQDALEVAPETERKEVMAQIDDKHDGIADKRIDSIVEGQNSITRLSDSDKAHPSESERDSVDDSIQIAESILQEKNRAINRDELNKEVMDMQVDEEKSGEEDEKDVEEHEIGKSGTDAPVSVETRDEEPKTAHKKSHNILSGVRSKVKHSIAKVKKAITGKSSHPKTTPPK